MSLDSLKIDSDVVETNPDVLPGSFTMDTNLYPTVVELAYMDKAKSGALALKVHLKLADGSPQTIRQTFWVTSGDKKGNKNYYINAKDKKKRLLPGMIQADQLAHITTGKALAELKSEQKTVKLWNSTTKAEEPTEIPVLTEMLGKSVLVGLHKVRDNKVTENADGEYVKTPDERFFNEIDKLFYPNGMTATEKLGGETAPKFKLRWAERYDRDFIMDRYVTVEGSSQPNLPMEGTASSSAGVASLFPDSE